MRVLLVEDNLPQLSLLTELLGFNGFTVASYPCVDQALQVLCSRSFDAVVTDYHLRGRRGCEIVRAATEIGLPSILITGAADRKEVARAVNLGARFVLVKPYDAQELFEKIRQAVNEKSVYGTIDAIIRRTGGTD